MICLLSRWTWDSQSPHYSSWSFMKRSDYRPIDYRLLNADEKQIHQHQASGVGPGDVELWGMEVSCLLWPHRPCWRLLDILGLQKLEIGENVGHERVFDGVNCVKMTAWRLILDVSVWFSKFEILVETNSPKKTANYTIKNIILVFWWKIRGFACGFILILCV